MNKEEILKKLDDIIGDFFLEKIDVDNVDCFDLLDAICLVHFRFYLGIDNLNIMIKRRMSLLDMYNSILEIYKLIDKGVDKQEAIKIVMTNNNIDKSKLN